MIKFKFGFRKNPGETHSHKNNCIFSSKFPNDYLKVVCILRVVPKLHTKHIVLPKLKAFTHKQIMLPKLKAYTQTNSNVNIK